MRGDSLVHFRRTGLAGDLYAVDPRVLPAAVVHDVDHHLGERLSDVGGDRFTDLLRLEVIDHRQVRLLPLRHQIRLVERAAVADRRHDVGCLHRRQPDVTLPDRGLAECRGALDVPQRALSHRQRHVIALVVDPEPLGDVADLRLAEIDAQLGERGVARDREGVDQGVVRPAVAARPAEVPDRRRALRQVQDVRRRDHRVRIEPLLECRRRDDHLEHRAGRVVVLCCTVQPRVDLRIVQRLRVVADRLRVVRTEQVRVVRRGADHREDRPGLWVQGHDRAGGPAVGQRPVRRLLGPAVQGELDVAALGRPPGEQVGQPSDEQRVGVTGEQVVLGPLDSGGGVDQRVVPGRVRVHRPVRVGAQVGQTISRGSSGGGHRPPVHHDRAALALVLRQQHPGVARILLIGARLDHLDVVGIEHERREEDEHRDGDPAYRLVHLETTSVLASASGGGAPIGPAGRRAASLIRASSATSAKFATSEEPP